MKFIREFLSNRTNVIEIFIVAILITLCINLITTTCYELLDFSNKDEMLLLLGIIILLLSVAYFILKIVWKTNIKKVFSGFILINKKDKLPVDCDGYDYLEELRRNLDAGFAENKALEHIWMNDSANRKEKNLLIIEATEYYLIDELSTHLTDYFNLRGLDKKQLVQISRNDIPDILFSNRFLELFSKPMEQRASFINDIDKKDKNERVGRIVYSMGGNGAVFKYFDFVLPKGSKVAKNEDYIEIDTKRFTIKIKVDYEGYGNVLPKGFEKYFLGFNPFEDVYATEIGIEVLVKFKFESLFYRNGWDYYEWIELFLEKVEKNFSQKNYFEAINWKQVYTQLKVNKNVK
ncbi:MAG: hypothetical protein H6Q17_2436 [Bacteroidetes bacterium]|nr:hypothetical protein [Bacteroidota bacterium]